jgi:hypothetical protein
MQPEYVQYLFPAVLSHRSGLSVRTYAGLPQRQALVEFDDATHRIRDLAGIGVSPLVRIGHHVKPGSVFDLLSSSFQARQSARFPSSSARFSHANQNMCNTSSLLSCRITAAFDHRCLSMLPEELLRQTLDDENLRKLLAWASHEVVARVCDGEMVAQLALSQCCA